MDASFHNLCLDANRISHAFTNSGNSGLIRETGADVVNSHDTTLQLNSLGFAAPPATSLIGVKRKWSSMDEPRIRHAGSLLDLGLGYSSSSSDTKGSTTTGCTSVSSVKEADSSSMDLELDFSLHLGGDKSPDSEKASSYTLGSSGERPMVDLQLSLFSGPVVSEVATFHSSHSVSDKVAKMITDSDLDADEGKRGKHFGQSQAAMLISNANFVNQPSGEITAASPSFSSSITTAHKTSVTCTSVVTQSRQQRVNVTKQCQSIGCVKGARGASGFCIAHGGGRRCQRTDCHKGAEGRTAFCKAHGGGRRCDYLGCTKSAEGRTDFCIAHGGGRRCSHEGCTRASRGKSGKCIRHGGGKRCQRENCTKSAEGLSGLCISHGGGRRCEFPDCKKGAQGSTKFCKAHGGGKRCTYPGCQKGAEGSTSFCKAHGGGKRCSFHGGGVCPKSVHGGTLFCVAHGGGKRCAIPECTKSARGRTDFCVRHGGGKRCQHQGCGKSAQGSTDFCKAHGGGKRCSWGHSGSFYGTGDEPCATYAKGKNALCSSHATLVQDKRVHGLEILETAVHGLKAIHPAGAKSHFPYIETHLGSHAANPPEKFPEGRVHGGNLIAAASSDADLAGTSLTWI